MYNLLKHYKFRLHHPKIINNQCSDCLQWNSLNKISTNTKNYYEILNLSRNCTSKEIRDAFLALSKKYHPDKNKGNPKAQEEFVKVSEAYNVLSKPESRRNYDFSLSSFAGPSQFYNSGKKDDYYEIHRYDSQFRDPWKDPSFYKNRNFEEEERNDKYYGIKGIKKQTNDKILFWLVLFAGVGLFVQISVIRFANTSTQLSRKKQSEENQRHLDYVRAKAEYYATRDRQLEELMLRSGGFKDKEPDGNTLKEDKPE